MPPLVVDEYSAPRDNPLAGLESLADLQATVNFDIGNAMLDALLTLNAPPSQQGAALPALMIALKGPLPAPERSVDTNVLRSWLTLRAIEQQSRQIKAMEQAIPERTIGASPSSEVR